MWVILHIAKRRASDGRQPLTVFGPFADRVAALTWWRNGTTRPDGTWAVIPMTEV